MFPFLRECRRMVHDPLYLSSIILPPLVCYILFTSLMAEGLPTKLPTGVVDMDDSHTSRSIVRNLGAYQHTHIVSHYPTAHEAFDAMQRGDIYGFYLIPERMEAEALSEKQPTVSFYLNEAYLIAGALLYKDMRTLSELTDADIGEEQLYARGAAQWQVMPILQPIVIEPHPLGNPWLNYSVYLNNTLLPGVLLLTVMLVTVYSIGGELKQGTAQEWLSAADGKILPALLGKLLPQTCLFFVMALLCVACLFGFLHFPLGGGLLPMLVALFLSVLATQAFGIFLFCLFPWMRMAMSAAALWSVVSFSISGFSFPAMAMSPTIQLLNNLFPLRHYFLIYANSALNGYAAEYAFTSYVALCLFILLPLPFLGRLKRVLTTYEYME